jgi:TonB family protein
VYLLRPLRFSFTLVLILFSAGSVPIHSQPLSAIQSQLNLAYKGKTLLLRDFYRGDDLAYEQNGSVLGNAAQGPWTLANVRITGVTVTALGMEIVGDRLGTWYKNEKAQFVKIDKLKIHIARAISDTDTEATLRPIFSRVFIQQGEEIGPMLPEYWRSYLAGTDSKSRAASWLASLEGHIPTFKIGKSSDGEVAPPRLVYDPEPKYSKEAVSNLVEGTSRLEAVIDAAGMPGSIAILQPLGMGLDEQAVLAVQQWKFQPATKNGQPVAVQMNVQINFRCCP